MFPMFAYPSPAAIPSATIPAPALVSIDLTTLAVLGAAVLAGLLVAAAIRLVRRPSRSTDIGVPVGAYREGGMTARDAEETFI